MKFCWPGVLLWVSLAAQGAPATPSDSLYQLQFDVVTQDGRQQRIDLYRGHVTLVSMFYASCPDVCPLLINALQNIDKQLTAAERQRLRVLLVSIDPKHDKPAVLHELANFHHVDASRWSLAQTREANVRQLAAALGIQYRELPNGDFNHSSVITLLDGEGRIQERTTSIGRVEPQFFAKLKSALLGPVNTNGIAALESQKAPCKARGVRFGSSK